MIEWPSGIKQYRTGVLTKQILDIEEDLVNTVKEELPIFGFKIFPNPTNSIIQLEAHFNEPMSVLMVEVFGDTGQVLYKTTFSQVSGHWQHQLDLRKLQLTPGQYIVRVGNGLSGEERKIIYAY